MIPSMCEVWVQFLELKLKEKVRKGQKGRQDGGKKEKWRRNLKVLKRRRAGKYLN